MPRGDMSKNEGILSDFRGTALNEKEGRESSLSQVSKAQRSSPLLLLCPEVCQ